MNKKEEKKVDIEKAKKYQEARIKCEMYCKENGIRPYKDKRIIKYSQEYVSKESGFEKSEISKFENGKKPFPERLDEYYQNNILGFFEKLKSLDNLENDNVIVNTNDENKLEVQKEECVNEINSTSINNDEQEYEKDDNKSSMPQSILKIALSDFSKRTIFLTIILFISIIALLIIAKGVLFKHYCVFIIMLYFLGIVVEYMEITFRHFVFPKKKNKRNNVG